MKLLTWNTQWCCGIDGTVSPERIVRTARGMGDFDVLCLQEIAQGYSGLQGAPGDQPAQLAALLPDFQLFFGAAVDEFDALGRRARFGNLIATRLPVLQVVHHRLPWPADGGVRSMPRMCTEVTVRDASLGPVRVMTTHLEFYSAGQRMAQARALREINAEAHARAAAPPPPDDDGSPFRGKAHTPNAILCGDFNLGPAEAEYFEIQQPVGGARLQDAWPLARGSAAHEATFRLFDRSYGPDPIACDFVFVSDSLAPQVRTMAVDGTTQASDHQPVLLVLG